MMLLTQKSSAEKASRAPEQDQVPVPCCAENPPCSFCTRYTGPFGAGSGAVSSLKLLRTWRSSPLPLPLQQGQPVQLHHLQGLFSSSLLLFLFSFSFHPLSFFNPHLSSRTALPVISLPSALLARRSPPLHFSSKPFPPPIVSCVKT